MVFMLSVWLGKNSLCCLGYAVTLGGENDYLHTKHHLRFYQLEQVSGYIKYFVHRITFLIRVIPFTMYIIDFTKSVPKKSLSG